MSDSARINLGLIVAVAALFAVNLAGLNPRGSYLADIVPRSVNMAPQSHEVPFARNENRPPPAPAPRLHAHAPRHGEPIHAVPVIHITPPTPQPKTRPPIIAPHPQSKANPALTAPAHAPQARTVRPQQVYHLRDLIVGLEWLTHAAPALRLTPPQRQQLKALLPAVRKNFESAPGTFDDELESQVAKILTAPQAAAVYERLSKPPLPDCMDKLRSLETLTGVAAGTKKGQPQ